MANHFVYGGIGAILGFLLGGFVVGAVCGKEYKKRIESLQHQIDRLKYEQDTAKENDIRDREIALSDPDPLKTLKKTAIYEGYTTTSEPIEEDEDEVEEDDLSDIELDEGIEDMFDEDDIYLIDAKDFQEDVGVRDNETLTFYQEDGVLVDDHNDKVENELRVVGREFMEKVKDTDEDFLYVSNDIEDKMYEIVVNHNESFYRDILGVTV